MLMIIVSWLAVESWTFILYLNTSSKVNAKCLVYGCVCICLSLLSHGIRFHTFARVNIIFLWMLNTQPMINANYWRVNEWSQSSCVSCVYITEDICSWKQSMKHMCLLKTKATTITLFVPFYICFVRLKESHSYFFSI